MSQLMGFELCGTEPAALGAVLCAGFAQPPHLCRLSDDVVALGWFPTPGCLAHMEQTFSTA